MDPRRQPRLASLRVSRALGRAALDRRSEPRAEERARAARARLRRRRFRMGRCARRRSERDHFPAQVPRRLGAAGRVQLHAGAARAVHGGRTPRRVLARAAQQRRRRLRRQRSRELRRRRSESAAGARPLPLAAAHAAAALDADLQAGAHPVKAAPQPELLQQYQRVVIESVAPIVDCGQFPIKRAVGEQVVVEADCYTDGHDALACELWFRHDGSGEWGRVAMRPLGNDRWRAAFSVDRIGIWRYHVKAWIDRLTTWRDEFLRRVDADDLRVAAQTGAEMIALAAKRAEEAHRPQLEAWAAQLREPHPTPEALRALALDPDLLTLARTYAERGAPAACHDLRVTVDRERARFSTWYELFPRSAAATPGAHGTFDDVRKRLAYIAGMGFDVLYLPPIHPIGRERRKGVNNAVTAAPDDVGSPWAIGSAEGGHKAVHPELGTHADFRRLLADARTCGIEIALD